MEEEGNRMRFSRALPITDEYLLLPVGYKLPEIGTSQDGRVLVGIKKVERNNTLAAKLTWSPVPNGTKVIAKALVEIEPSGNVKVLDIDSAWLEEVEQ